MVLLFAILSYLLVSSNAQRPPAVCTNDTTGIYCGDCKTAVRCSVADSRNNAAPSEVIFTCPANQACGKIADTVSCQDLANTDCACTAPFCDTYSPMNLAVCSSTGLFLVSDCGTDQACYENKCTDLASIPSTVATTTTPLPTTQSIADACTEANEFKPILPTCEQGVFCIDGDNGVIFAECEDGEVFDGSTGTCVSLTPTCGTCMDSVCPDITDCKKYIICSNGEVVGNGECLETDTSFNSEKPYQCTTSAVCHPLTECVVESSGDSSSSSSDSLSSSSSSDYSSSDSSSSDSSSSDSSSSDSSSSDSSSSDSSSSDSSSTSSSSSDSSTAFLPSQCNAENENINYIYPPDCSRYWGCREISTGQYEFELLRCSVGLLFDETRGSCYLNDQVQC